MLADLGLQRHTDDVIDDEHTDIRIKALMPKVGIDLVMCLKKMLLLIFYLDLVLMQIYLPFEDPVDEDSPDGIEIQISDLSG